MQFVSPRGYLSHKESLDAHVFRNPPARPPLEAEEIMTSCEVFPAKGVQAVKSEGCKYELHRFNLLFLLSLSQGIRRAVPHTKNIPLHPSLSFLLIIQAGNN